MVGALGRRRLVLPGVDAVRAIPRSEALVTEQVGGLRVDHAEPQRRRHDFPDEVALHAGAGGLRGDVDDVCQTHACLDLVHLLRQHVLQFLDVLFALSGRDCVLNVLLRVARGGPADGSPVVELGRDDDRLTGGVAGVVEVVFLSHGVPPRNRWMAFTEYNTS